MNKNKILNFVFPHLTHIEIIVLFILIGYILFKFWFVACLYCGGCLHSSKEIEDEVFEGDIDDNDCNALLEKASPTPERLAI